MEGAGAIACHGNAGCIGHCNMNSVQTNVEGARMISDNSAS